MMRLGRQARPRIPSLVEDPEQFRIPAGTPKLNQALGTQGKIQPDDAVKRHDPDTERQKGRKQDEPARTSDLRTPTLMGGGDRLGMGCLA